MFEVEMSRLDRIVCKDLNEGGDGFADDVLRGCVGGVQAPDGWEVDAEELGGEVCDLHYEQILLEP
jgi:hypothetical protein